MEHYIFHPEKLKDRRKSLKFSVHKLAELSQVDASMISRIETKKNVPSAPVLGRLAGALRVSPNYFYEREQVKVEIADKQQ